MQLEFKSWVILEPLDRGHLSDPVDVDKGSIRLVDTEEEIDHGLAERVLKVVVIVTTDRSDQLWNRVHERLLVLL